MIMILFPLSVKKHTFGKEFQWLGIHNTLRLFWQLHSLHSTLCTISYFLEEYAATANQKSLDYMMEEKRLTPLIHKVQ